MDKLLLMSFPKWNELAEATFLNTDFEKAEIIS
jgi:hypothetical protein